MDMICLHSHFSIWYCSRCMAWCYCYGLMSGVPIMLFAIFYLFIFFLYLLLGPLSFLNLDDLIMGNPISFSVGPRSFLFIIMFFFLNFF